MREERILIGTVKELSESINPGVSGIRALGELGTIEDQLERILFEGALMENGAMGIVFFMAEISSELSGEIPQIELAIQQQYVFVRSQEENHDT